MSGVEITKEILEARLEMQVQDQHVAKINAWTGAGGRVGVMDREVAITRLALECLARRATDEGTHVCGGELRYWPQDKCGLCGDGTIQNPIRATDEGAVVVEADLIVFYPVHGLRFYFGGYVNSTGIEEHDKAVEALSIGNAVFTIRRRSVEPAGGGSNDG